MTIGRPVVFLSVLVALSASAHYYLWLRWVHAPAWSRAATVSGTVAIIALALLPITIVAMSRIAPSGVTARLSTLSYLWIGALFLSLTVLGISDLFAVASRVVAQAGPESIDSGRRWWAARSFALVTLGLSGGVSGLSVYGAIGPVRVKRVAVKLRQLGADARGFRLVQLSDVHIGATLREGVVDQLVHTVNSLKPDAVVITGDLVDGRVAQLGSIVARFSALESKFGTYFVTGNHEYYSGAREWVAFLTTLGVRCLRNERVEINVSGSSGFDLVGVDDWAAFGQGHGRDLHKALEGRRADRPAVLLAHQPKQFPEAAERGVDLQLSGHTHGGQIWPFNFLVKLDQPYVDGLHRIGESQIYVSRGTGFWGPPMRLGAPAEVTLLELQPA